MKLSSGEACTFSAISGTLTKNGAPLAGVTVTRNVDWQGNKTETTTTDAKGYFSFDHHVERSIAKVLPMQFSAKQTIDVLVDGENFNIWEGVKLTPGFNSENRGVPLEVECDINDPLVTISIERQPIITSCKWDVEVDKPFSEDDFFD